MNGTFLQSSEWEHIHQLMGRKTWRVQGVLVVQHNLPHGLDYLYCARPDLRTVSLEEFFEEIQKIAHVEGSIFFKIDPVEPISFENLMVRAKESTPLQPQETIVLDVLKSEEDLMAAMHEKTRYNIRLAERKEIEVVQVMYRDVKNDFKVFWNLLSETATRRGFSAHEQKHYEFLSTVRTAAMSNELFFVRMRSNHSVVLATAMVNFYHDPRTGISSATYLHGASSREHKDLMASYLLHWRIAQEAKKRGMACYDLWGIDEKRWPGVTRFKKGFGGAVVRYPASLNIVYRPMWYMVYQLVKKR